MSGTNGEPGREPDNIFGGLRERPTPELDSRGLWRRIEAQMAPRSASRWARWLSGWGEQPLTLRFAYGVAAVAVVALAAWAATLTLQPQPPAARFVLLTPDEPEGGSAPLAPDPQTTSDATVVGGAGSTGEPLQLDVRLVRGFDGAPPRDVRSARSLGVGGADALRDVRTRIESLLPFEGFGVVGAWRGSVVPGAALDIELSDDYRLVARAATGGDGPGDMVRLNGMELAGSGQQSVSADLTLEPGRLYILGVLAGGAKTPELVLLIRARAPAEGRR